MLNMHCEISFDRLSGLTFGIDLVDLCKKMSLPSLKASGLTFGISIVLIFHTNIENQNQKLHW